MTFAVLQQSFCSQKWLLKKGICLKSSWRDVRDLFLINKGFSFFLSRNRCTYVLNPQSLFTSLLPLLLFFLKLSCKKTVLVERPSSFMEFSTSKVATEVLLCLGIFSFLRVTWGRSGLSNEIMYCKHFSLGSWLFPLCGSANSDSY